MKKIPITHEIFNGDLNGISRRAVINELLRNKHICQTPIQKYSKTIKTIVFISLIWFILLLSIMTFVKNSAWDSGYEYAIKSIYNGSKSDVESNKKKAFANIAGAGDDGYRKVYESK